MEKDTDHNDTVLSPNDILERRKDKLRITDNQIQLKHEGQRACFKDTFTSCNWRAYPGNIPGGLAELWRADSQPL